jgi:uncharacterized protein
LYLQDGFTAVGNLESRLLYGNHPEVYLSVYNQEEILKEIAGSYLFKDILSYQEIKRSDLLKKLLQALALQLGNQVSYSELAGIVGMDRKTIERYIYLLEQSFILFRVGSFSRNIRNELKRSQKIYFWDVGIRNAVINSFSPLGQRNDTGALWENYYLSERRKYLLNNRISFEHYFWRTTQKQEIDLVELQGAEITASEIKWSPEKKPRFPLTFTQEYSEAQLLTINRDNYLKQVIDHYPE